MTKLLSILLLLSSCLPGHSQSVVTRDIRSFGAKGDGRTNDHAAFQRAADFFNARGGNGKLVIAKGTYVVGKQQFNKNTKKAYAYEGQALLHLVQAENFSISGVGAPVIKYEGGLRFGSFSPLTGKPNNNGNNFFDPTFAGGIGNAIQLTRCRNIVVSGLELNGNSDEMILGGIWGDVGRQLPHSGVLIENSTNVTITEVKSHHFGLDGIQISNATGNSKMKDRLTIINSLFEYNGRQGLSWVGGNDLTVINSGFNHTGKGKLVSAPAAGVDIEAEVGTVSNGKFIKCQFINNTGVAFLADSGPSSDCLMTDCLFWGLDSWSVWVRKPRFTFERCTVRGSIVHGYNADNDRDATRFLNCTFEDKPYEGKETYGRFLIETNFAKRMRFENCVMIADKKNLMWIDAGPSATADEKYKMINCRFIYKGEGVPLNNSFFCSNCSFEATSPSTKKITITKIDKDGRMKS